MFYAEQRIIKKY